MTHTEEIKNKFYQNLGKLFYAIAASDKIIREQEISTLKDVVRSEWLSLDDNTDEFKTDSAFQIEIVFDWLMEQNENAGKNLTEFIAFKKENEALFDEKVNKLILKTCYAIADAFSGKNTVEQQLLSELEALLK
jgi:hypothetical protein